MIVLVFFTNTLPCVRTEFSSATTNVSSAEPKVLVAVALLAKRGFVGVVETVIAVAVDPAPGAGLAATAVEATAAEIKPVLGAAVEKVVFCLYNF